MDDVKKKVLLDLFASPWTVLPVVAGFTSMIVSWAIGGDALLNFAGLGGILAGAGVSATRLIFGLEKITQDAYEYLREKQRQKQEAVLDALDRNLRLDRDSRTQKSLRELRELHGRFRRDAGTRRLVSAHGEIGEKVEEVFRACVGQLEESYKLWKSAQSLSGAAAAQLLDQREQVIREVLDTVGHLRKNLDDLQTVRARRNDTDLARLREELDETMLVARRTEQRLEALGKTEGYTEREIE